MILRVLNFIVIGALVLAAAYVYRIKYNSTVQAEHLAKLRGEVRHARDSIAALRAEWGELDNPARIQTLAKRYLHLRAIAPTQFDTLDHLPDRPPEDATATNNDPIGGLLENLEEPETVTGSIAPSSSPSQAGPDVTDSPGNAPSPPSPQAGADVTDSPGNAPAAAAAGANTVPAGGAAN
jgi:hypothetical protein